MNLHDDKNQFNFCSTLERKLIVIHFNPIMNTELQYCWLKIWQKSNIFLIFDNFFVSLKFSLEENNCRGRTSILIIYFAVFILITCIRIVPLQKKFQIPADVDTLVKDTVILSVLHYSATNCGANKSFLVFFSKEKALLFILWLFPLEGVANISVDTVPVLLIRSCILIKHILGSCEIKASW